MQHGDQLDDPVHVACVRLNVVVRTTGFIRCLVIDLARENSRSPSAP